MHRFPGGAGPQGRIAGGLTVGILFVFLGCGGPGVPAPAGDRVAPVAAIDVQAKQLRTALPAREPTIPRHLTSLTAFAWSAQELSVQRDLPAWVRGVRERGIGLIILDIGTRRGRAHADGDEGRQGVYFRSSWAPTVEDVFGAVVPLAHQHGIAVFAAVSPRDMNWVDPTWGWFDRRVDATHREVRLSPYLDLFHPGFQEYLTGLLGDLAETGIDGVLFRGTPDFGPYEGFSPFALRSFERDFKVRVEPVDLFLAVSGGEAGARQFRPEFWQWMGWKARERLHVIGRMVQAMRVRAPTLHLALEVHPETVTDPLRALVRYGEDLLEAKRNVDFFLVGPSPLRHPASSAPANQDPRPSSIIEQMTALVGTADRIWLNTPVTVNPAGHPMESAMWAPGAWPNGVGIVHVGWSASLP